MAAVSDEIEAELLKKAFKAVDVRGSGRFPRSELEKVFLDLGEWTSEDLKELFDAVDTKKDGSISYTELIDHIMEDGTDEPDADAEDDEDGSDEEFDDSNIMLHKDDPGWAHLNLNERLTQDQFTEVLRHLDVDASEGPELFTNIAREARDAGFNTKDGIKVKWFLDDLSIDRKDQDSLKNLEAAIKEVKAGHAAATGLGEHALNIALDTLAATMEAQGAAASEAWTYAQSVHCMSQAGKEAISAKFLNNKAGLVTAVQSVMDSPPLLPSSAGQTSVREQCAARVAQLVRQCRAAGTKFLDEDFDVEHHTAQCLYVDKEKPGWDCTVAAPTGFKRITELCKEPILFRGGASAGDIKQGQIGTCFLLGALGAVAANKKDAIRRAFLSYDIDLGIYGVRFCVNGEWEYVIVDDVMPVDKYGRFLYARSADPDEVWCPILEKAYCKLHTCYEMCDGGRPNQAIFAICGGASGKFDISDAHRKDPSTYFTLLEVALKRGWLLTTTFVVTKATLAKAGAGKCGESVLSTGLVGGHVYSVLRIVDAGSEKLVCCRNPWGTGEWKGKYSDANAHGEWTPDLVKATGWTNVNDGTFWMNIQDFVDNSGGVEYARTFDPRWKKITQKSKFRTEKLQAVSMWAYAARQNHELGFPKGATLEVHRLAKGWWQGCVAGEPSVVGYFPANYVKMKERPVARFDLQATSSTGASTVEMVVMLTQPNSKMERRFYQRQNGLNYKDISYPSIQLVILAPDGSLVLKREGQKRCVSSEVNLEGGVAYSVFALSLDGKGQQFSLRVYVKEAGVSLKAVEGANVSDIAKAISS